MTLNKQLKTSFLTLLAAFVFGVNADNSQFPPKDLFTGKPTQQIQPKMRVIPPPIRNTTLSRPNTPYLAQPRFSTRTYPRNPIAPRMPNYPRNYTQNYAQQRYPQSYQRQAYPQQRYPRFPAQRPITRTPPYNPSNNNNSFPFSGGGMPFMNNNGNNGFGNFSNPFGNNMFGNNANSKMPFFPSTNNKKRKKAWGTERNIWPDFYTDFTDEAWDTMMSGPRDLGEMPGGWRFPYISMPDPVTVSDAITNQFPPIAEEAGNMADFSDWGVFD